MIAKRVPARKGTSSVVKLARYITGLKATGDPASWPRLVDYITDARSDGARVVDVRLTNLDSDEVGFAVKEIAATQALNTRSKGDKTYHLVVSFPPGERPSREILYAIEDELCAAIGLADHQRISAAHDDKDHFHVHVAINKVHPVTLRHVEPFYDKRALMRTCAEIERKYGLTITNHGEDAERKPRDRARDMEAHSGQESLARWIKTNAAAALVQAAATATRWHELHDAAAQHGLEFRKRGAGLVIGVIGEPVAVKASDVDRRLAFKALTDRLGTFDAPAHRDERTPTAERRDTPQPAPERRQYRKQPRQSVPGTAALFADYQRQRVAALAARAAARATVTAERAAYARQLRLWHAEQRRAIKEGSHLSPLEKRGAYRALGAERRTTWRTHRTSLAAARAAVAAQHPLPTWQNFLETAAARGDAVALAVLRSRRQPGQRLAFDLLTAEDAAQARQVVFKELGPTVKRNGELVYHVRDGGRVTDAADHVRVDELTVGAAFLALSLAAERFAGRALKVEGSDAFKAQIAALAAMKGLDVWFDDPALEQARQQAAERVAPAPADRSAVAQFIAKRNKTRAQTSDITHHRAWVAEDAGPAEYAGRRRLSDGSEAVLLKKDGETLVMPVTSAQAAKASQWHLGQIVTTDSRGRFTERRRGR